LGDAPEVLVGEKDFNGDGRADIAIGSFRRDNNGLNDRGSVSIVGGRVDDYPGQITVICEPTYEHFGGSENDHLGYSLAFMNDINNDGCDELAIGVRLESMDDFRAQGGAHILFGFGNGNCFADPHFIRLNSSTPWIQLGTSVATGDVDGDGIDELAIGAPYAQDNNQARGGVWVLPGTFLQSITPAPLGQAESHWIDASHGIRFIPGLTDGGETGRGLFIASGLVGVGTMGDFVFGTASVSTFRLYGMSEDGDIDLEPRGLVIGELLRPGSMMGERISLSVSADEQSLLLGAPRGGGIGKDSGSAYWLDLSSLTP
jgi:hypothetical protein